MSTMAFAGTAFAHYSEWYGKEGQETAPTYMNDALSQLPKQKAADFRDTMSAAQENNKDLQEQLYRLHDSLHAILVAPTFDRDAFLNKRAEIQRVHDQMETNRTEAFASAVSDLSQQERMTLTRALHHGHEHGHHTKVPAQDANSAVKQH